MRLYHWQHRSNSVRTWHGMKSEAVITADVVYTLTTMTAANGRIVSVGGEIDCGADCSETLIENTVISLQAAPDSTYYFTGWGGDCSGTGNCELPIDSDKTVTAQFAVITVPSLKAANAVPLVQVATSACGESDSPHWQCAGQYLTADTSVVGSYVGGCPHGANAYDDCMATHQFVRFESLQPTSGILSCLDINNLGESRGSCPT